MSSSIAILMVAVLLIAADFVIVMALWILDRPGPQVGVAIVVLPTANLLLLASPKLAKGNATRPFWLGFEAVGWAMVLFFGHLAWHQPQTFFWPIDALDQKHFFEDGAVNLDLLISVVVVSTPPQRLVALLTERLVAKFRVIIGRR